MSVTTSNRKKLMSYATLTTDGPVSIVTLNRPERLNAIGAVLLQDMHAALVEAQTDPATRVIVLTGSGRAFCAGDDLKEFGDQALSAASISDTCDNIQRITRDIMFGPKLVVGAIHGYAVGGGFEWVLNCDLVVAADNLTCFFPEMSLGHFVTGGVTYLLPQLLGHQKSLELFVLGEHLSASDLRELGIVNKVVTMENMLSQAIVLAKQIAERSTHATSQLKRVMNSQLHPYLTNALELERQSAISCFGNADTERRIKNFMSKRM